MSRAGELLNVDDTIYALDHKLVIFLMRSLTWRCRLAHKVVWKRHQLHVEIYIWRNKAFLIEHVQMKATDELDHGTSRKCRGTSVEIGIVSTDCGDNHVPGCILGPALAQKTGFFKSLYRS